MIGKIELAEGGTLFLDEINSMPLNLQSKLLRFLQTNSFMRLGGYKEMVVNVRVIAATNRDLKEEMRKGNFREDLFYRLNVVSIKIPPLRDRMEDLNSLITYFLNKYSNEDGRQYTAESEYIDYLKRYNWPGNVRELENVMVRAMAISYDGKLTVKNLPDDITKVVAMPDRFINEVESNLPLDVREKTYIEKVIAEAEGNMALAARILGIGRSTLYRKIKKYNIDA